MNSEHTIKSPKRKLSLVRILSVAVILITAAVYLVGEKRNSLTETCARSKSVTKDTQNTQEILDACDMLLAWFVIEPTQVSLFYQQKLRVFARKENSAGVLSTVEKAISATPENETLWRIKAWYLYSVGDHAASLDALEVAADLDPKNLDVLKFRLQLSFKLRGHEGVDEVFSELIHEHDDLDWLFLKIPHEVYVEAANFPLSHKAIRHQFSKVQQKLRVDPANTKYRTDMLNFCLFLGPNCPPLFPEKRSNYPKMTCDAAIDRLLELHPKPYMNIKGIKDVPVRDLFRERDWRAKVILQAHYISAALRFERGNPAEAKADLILFTRVFHCVSGGKFYIPENFRDDPVDKDEKIERRLQDEHLYGLERQRNLVDLAHATPDE